MSKQRNNEAQQQSTKSEPSAAMQALNWGGAKAWAAMKAPFDDTFFQWMAHGSTEVANMLLHGHAAPVYSHYRAPDQSDPEPLAMNSAQDAKAPETQTERQAIPEKNLSPAAPAKSLTEPISQQQAVSGEPAVTSHGPIEPKAMGILDRHMDDLQNLPQQKQPEQEMSM